MIKVNQQFTGVNVPQIVEKSYSIIAAGRGNDNQVLGLLFLQEIRIG